MALNIPTGFAQITWLFGGADVPNGAAVTQGVDVGGSLTIGEIADVAFNAWDDGIKQVQSANTVLTGIRVKAGPMASGVQGEVSYSVPGNAVGSAVPPNVALLVRKVTNLGGRQGRGRMYWPGFTEPDVSGSGTINGGYLATVQGHADTTFNALMTDLLIPVLFHDESGPVTVPTPLVSWTVDAKVATQRRRLRP